MLWCFLRQIQPHSVSRIEWCWLKHGIWVTWIVWTCFYWWCSIMGTVHIEKKTTHGYIIGVWKIYWTHCICSFRSSMHDALITVRCFTGIESNPPLHIPIKGFPWKWSREIKIYSLQSLWGKDLGLFHLRSWGGHNGKFCWSLPIY